MHVLKMILAGLEFTSLLITIIVFAGLLAVVYFFYNQLEKGRAKRNRSGNKRPVNPHRAFYESLITALIIFITVMLLLSTCGRL